MSRQPEIEQSLGGMFARLGQLFTTLIRSEFELAKAEAGQKAVQLGLGAGAVIGGAMISLAGVIVLYEAFVALMREYAGVHPVFSGLGATILIALLAGWLVYSGIRRLKPSGLVPRRTIDSLPVSYTHLTLPTNREV